MSSYFKELQEEKTQREIFIENFINSFDSWFEANNFENKLSEAKTDQILGVIFDRGVSGLVELLCPKQ